MNQYPYNPILTAPPIPVPGATAPMPQDQGGFMELIRMMQEREAAQQPQQGGGLSSLLNGGGRFAKGLSSLSEPAAATPSLGNAAGIDAMFPAAEAGAGAAGAQTPAGAAGIPGAAIAAPIAASAAGMWKYGLGPDGIASPKHLWEQTYGRAAKGIGSGIGKIGDWFGRIV